MGKEAKTNAMRILEREKVPYTAHEYAHEEGVAVAGVDVAGSMGEDPACVYKTLVTQGNSKNYFVFVIPVAAELDLKAAARSKAEEILAEWKAGEATEDSFAALANELSADDGSNTNGGLYTKIYKNQMVTEFNDWCFDASRQSGDTGIVYGESSNYKGYHVMYFVGDDVPYWQVQAENALRNTDTEAWLDGLLDSAEVVQENGMKHVG